MRAVEIYKGNHHKIVVILSSSVQIAYSCKLKKKKVCSREYTTQGLWRHV